MVGRWPRSCRTVKTGTPARRATSAGDRRRACRRVHWTGAPYAEDPGVSATSGPPGAPGQHPGRSGLCREGRRVRTGDIDTAARLVLPALAGRPLVEWRRVGHRLRVSARCPPGVLEGLAASIERYPADSGLAAAGDPIVIGASAVALAPASPSSVEARTTMRLAS